MNVTYHAHERYCERFMGMQNKKDIKDYLLDKDNQRNVTERIQELYTASSFLYAGMILKEDPIRNFHIVNDVIMCIDKDYANILTLYKIDYGFPTQTTQMVINNLITEIGALKEDLADIEKDNEVYQVSCEYDIQKLDEQIVELQEAISILNKKKQLIIDELKIKNASGNHLHTQIRKYAMQLINSWEYKRDFSKDSYIK